MCEGPKEPWGLHSRIENGIHGGSDLRRLFVAATYLILTTSVHAGPLFDDYLNYVRPGDGTGPGATKVSVASDKPVGQTFAVADGAGEVYRIGVRPVYDTWNPGESVTLTLYDSADRKQKLGSYTIDEGTCRVQAPVVGDGSKFSDTNDRVLYFQLRAPTKGLKQLYFELTTAGGDGRVAFQAFSSDVYPRGQANPSTAASDVSFECHIKPVPDKEANLRKFFTERLDISRPELAAVKAAVDAKDWEKAIAETVKHFHNRSELWADWKDVMQVKIDPTVSTELADLLMKDQLKHTEKNVPIPWRKESYWTPEYPDLRVGPKKSFEPSPYLWHFDRHLAGAYTATGKPEYARKAIDLRMQFILDNPSPKRSGLPWYFELWNDRTAGARTPGHGDLVYARLYDFPGWTNDEKMVFFSFWEDNGFWVYQGTSGGNWGAECARASMDFGLTFPEWKISANCVAWGVQRMAEVVLDSVRPEGVSHEAAIKYHAMVARRLRSSMEVVLSAKAKLDPDVAKRLIERLGLMYEHMAYTLQPNSYVVMCGDSWYENFTGELAETGKMLKRPDFSYVATQGKEGTPPPEVSKVYPESGYFIMRSDFGGKGLNYADSRQMFIHNGGWFGSHGHPDLTAINLYGYGRTLVIDPGQYAYTPPEGIDVYWTSRIHSMMVPEGRDAKREPGPSEWVSNSLIDWFDGRHYGYKNMDKIDYLRRRVAFIKPDYFLVDDSASTTRDTDWTLVWNLTDPNARIDESTKTIDTTFPSGGNITILTLDPEKCGVTEAPGITASAEAYPKTRIFRLTEKTANPRFASLLYPYKAGAKPDVKWERLNPDDRSASDLFYSVRITDTRAGKQNVRWAAFGECGKTVSYRGGKHIANADFALVHLDHGFTWARGRRLVFDGNTLATADGEVLSLAVHYGSKLTVDVKDPESTLAINTRGIKRIVLNGKPVAKPVVRSGMYYPFAGTPRTIVADDRDAFVRTTQTNEWGRICDPNAWSTGYTHHETDPGRHEGGDFVLSVPKTGTYAVEVFLPKATMDPSDAVEYRVPAMGRPVEAGGAVKAVREDNGAWVFTLDQRARSGWVRLGEFGLPKGEMRINLRNVTQLDGVYLIVDAARLVARQ